MSLFTSDPGAQYPWIRDEEIDRQMAERGFTFSRKGPQDNLTDGDIDRIYTCADGQSVEVVGNGWDYRTFLVRPTTAYPLQESQHGLLRDPD